MTSLLSPLTQSHQSQRRAAFLRGVGLALLALVIFSRSPDVLLNARFFAEDGQIFYQQAHELGFLPSIFLPFAGYLHLLPRLIAGIALWLPIYFVPLFFNLVALAVQYVTALYIFSPRMRNIGPFSVRVVVAVLYLGLPHIGEVWGKLVNSQWQMAVLAFLILIAAPPESRFGSWFDGIALSMGALTGPFCILLLPIALLVVVYRRTPWTMIHLGILAMGGTVQAIPLLTTGRPAEYANLGASFPLLCHLLIRWLFLGVLPTGSKVLTLLRPMAGSRLFSGFIWALALALALWIVWKASFELRCALLFGAIVITASLASPKIVTGGEQWPGMLTGGGERYWFIPRLVLAVTVLWVALQPFSKPWLRAGGILAMAAILLCSVLGWHIQQWKSPHFRTYVHVFNALPVGAPLRIPIDPPPGRALQLTKRPSDPISHNVTFTDGEVLRTSAWQSQIHFSVAKETTAPCVGAFLWINGTAVRGADVLPLVRVSIRDGALVEGWAIVPKVPEGSEFIPSDQIYAVASDYVVRGDWLPLSGERNKRLGSAAYLVFLPSRILRPGLQEVTVMGYSERDRQLHGYGPKLYIYGD